MNKFNQRTLPDLQGHPSISVLCVLNELIDAEKN